MRVFNCAKMRQILKPLNTSSTELLCQQKSPSSSTSSSEKEVKCPAHLFTCSNRSEFDSIGQQNDTRLNCNSSHKENCLQYIPNTVNMGKYFNISNGKTRTKVKTINRMLSHCTSSSHVRQSKPSIESNTSGNHFQTSKVCAFRRGKLSANSASDQWITSQSDRWPPVPVWRQLMWLCSVFVSVAKWTVDRFTGVCVQCAMYFVNHHRHHHHNRPLQSATNKWISAGQRSIDMILYAAVALIAAVCFLNSLHGDFVHDDIPAIVQNPDVLGTTTIGQLFSHDFWGKPMADPDSHKSYRPITTLTFRANMYFSTNPFGFHLVNVFLHTVVSVLVCRLVRQVLGFDVKLALLASTLFATHPIHCEAVTSIVGRADVLCALFYLCAFFAFHRSLGSHLSIGSQLVSVATCVLCSALALLSKETGITVIGVCAFYWGFVQLCPTLPSSPSSRSSPHSSFPPPQGIDSKPKTTTVAAVLSLQNFNQCLLQRFVPISVITLSFAILLTLRLWMLGETLPLFSEQDNPASYSKSTLVRILTYLYLAVFNLQLMISPKHQAYDWQTGSIHLVKSLADGRNAITACLLLGFTVLVYRIVQSLLHTHPRHSEAPQHHHQPPQANEHNSTEPADYLANYDSECVQNVSHYSCTRTLFVSLLFLVLPYIPASNLFITVGFVVAERLLYIPSIGFVCLICAGFKQLCRTSKQNTIWNKILMPTFGLCQATLACLVFIFALKTIQQNHVWSSRETLYKSGIENVPENAKAHYNYANLQQDMGNLHDAMVHYQTAIRLWPQHASAHNNLGALFWKISQSDHAEKHFSAALKINPYHAKAHFNLGKVYSKRGQTLEAIVLMERSIRLDNRFGESYEALAALYAQIGHVAIAEKLHQRALRLRPRNADFYNNYGAFLQKNGRFEYAVHQYQRALELKPNHLIATLNAANALTVLQRYEQAEHFYKRALKLKEDLGTLDSLGTLYMRQSKLRLARHVYEHIWNRFSPSSQTTLSPLSISTAKIHYAQLLILEGRYGDAEVLLEALTRLEQQQRQMHNAWQHDKQSMEQPAENHQRIQRATHPPITMMMTNTDDHQLTGFRTLADGGAVMQPTKQQSNSKDDFGLPHRDNQSGPAENQSLRSFQVVQYRASAPVVLFERQRYPSAEDSQHNPQTAPDNTLNRNELYRQNNEQQTEKSNLDSKYACSHSSQHGDSMPQAKSSVEPNRFKSNDDDDHHHQHFKYRFQLHDFGSTGTVETSDKRTKNAKGNTRAEQRVNGKRPPSKQLPVNHASLPLIDVHHQLALLYTLTNRSAEALESVTKALELCTPNTLATIATSLSLNEIDQNSRCGQIYTLQGDIQKDLHQWPSAIESYKKAIELDECLVRPHLHLAVIYHIEEQFTNALIHYRLAQQLDTGHHLSLINENMSKLHRQHRHLLYHNRAQMATEKVWTVQPSRGCQSRSYYAVKTAPITVPDRGSFMSETETPLNNNHARLFSVHTSTQIMSSL